MSIKKIFVPEKGVCRVIFTLPETLRDHAKKVALVGDFNDWHPDKHPMKKLKNGRYAFTLELPLGKDYQFRYLIDNYRWESDLEADYMSGTGYNETLNSVVKCTWP